MSGGPVTREFERRVKAESEKAFRKYGKDALLPAGRPDLDIIDYQINELVGMVRYSQMLEARSRLMLDVMEGLPAQTRTALKDAIGLARRLEAQAASGAYDLIAVWLKLREKGLHLGLTEAAA